MLPNEFVSITSVHPGFRTTYRRPCILEDAEKVAHRILSELAVACFRRYGVMPFVTLQVKTEGEVDTYTYYVTFPKRAKTHYIVRYVLFNDLPF